VIPAVRFGKRAEPARRGYRFIAVEVQATNVPKLANCTSFDASLAVDAGHDYSARRPDDPRQPKLSDLLAGEHAAGSFVFEVEDGLTLRWLTLAQRAATWPGCEMRGRVDLISPRVSVAAAQCVLIRALSQRIQPRGDGGASAATPDSGGNREATGFKIPCAAPPRPLRRAGRWPAAFRE